jgi:hypothetical protein
MEHDEMLKLENAVAKVASVNCRKERHGENLVLAVDVDLKISCTAEILDQLDPTLKEHVYGEHGPRYPEIGSYSWRREFENHELKLGKSTFKEVTLRKISFTPDAGESVALSLQATWYPNAKDVGPLADLIGERVTISTVPLQRDLVDEQKTGTNG